MARKFLYLIAGLIVLAMVVLIALNLWSQSLTRYAFVPKVPFEAQAPTTANAYSDPAMWFSRPGKGPGDPALWLPEGAAAPAQGGRPIAVFFVHPTSYLARDHWNAPLNDPASQGTALLYVRGMASPFNGGAEVWAPRYRQAAIGAFLDTGTTGTKAIDLAYGGVSRAFDTFLAEIPADSGIVMAGHSQGSLLLLRLIRDRIAGTPLAGRLVAAYPIGWPISVDHDLPLLGVPACAAPDQTGCVISWSSFAEPAEPAKVAGGYAMSAGLDGRPRGTSPILCTNPLTGTAGGEAPASANLGTLVPTADLTGGTLTPAAVPAKCDANGLLLIGDPPEMGRFVLPGNNYHVYDIPLFWANLRADAARREAAWQSRR